MKKLVVVEIDCPEGYDMVWDHDESGAQVFHDAVKQFAMQGATRALFDTIKELSEKGIPEDKHSEDRYYQFIERRVDIVTFCKPVGYIKDNEFKPLNP